MMYRGLIVLDNLDSDNVDSVKFSTDNMPIEILTEADFNIRFPPKLQVSSELKQ